MTGPELESRSTQVPSGTPLLAIWRVVSSLNKTAAISSQRFHASPLKQVQISLLVNRHPTYYQRWSIPSWSEKKFWARWICNGSFSALSCGRGPEYKCPLTDSPLPLHWAVWTLEDPSIQPSLSCSHPLGAGAPPILTDPPLCPQALPCEWWFRTVRGRQSPPDRHSIRPDIDVRQWNRGVQIITCFSSCLRGCRILSWA